MSEKVGVAARSEPGFSFSHAIISERDGNSGSKHGAVFAPRTVPRGREGRGAAETQTAADAEVRQEGDTEETGHRDVDGGTAGGSLPGWLVRTVGPLVAGNGQTTVSLWLGQFKLYYLHYVVGY